ncbi:MAG: hypothetical protein CMJ83_22105 [Planctomycetes bacterium]|nr:hypothetical protein [Planctomycetota bacterium]
MVDPPDGIPMWWFFTAMSLAVLIVGLSKSGFGGGIGIVAIPLMAHALRVDHAVGVILPLLLAADAVAVWQHRGTWSNHRIRHTVTGAVFGIAIGGLVLWLLQGSGRLIPALNGVVGATCLAFVALQLWRMLGGAVPRIPDTTTSGTTAGALCGVVSTVAHSAGPIMSIYLLEHRLEKRVLVGTLCLFFFIVNAAKLPVYLGLSLITGETLLTSAVFLPLVPVGAGIGLWMHHRVPERPFVLVMYLGAAAAGAGMLFKAL